MSEKVKAFLDLQLGKYISKKLTVLIITLIMLALAGFGVIVLTQPLIDMWVTCFVVYVSSQGVIDAVTAVGEWRK